MNDHVKVPRCRISEYADGHWQAEYFDHKDDRWQTCRWQPLSNPGPNHYDPMVTPRVYASYAEAHDDVMAWQQEYRDERAAVVPITWVELP